MKIVPLGDQGALVQLPSENDALRFAEQVRSAALSEVADVVAAYTTVAVFHRSALADVGSILKKLRTIPMNSSSAAFVGRMHFIPCCYELGLDLADAASALGLKPNDLIELHASAEYTVYAIGFCPGFPYLGYLPQQLCGLPRLPSPRIAVEPGSVGMTGRQTGIYPLARPGGWNLIGRTPLELVNVEDEYFPIRAGDRVRFRSISRDEFDALRGKRL
jgi:inhibitor of KinA